MMGERSEVSIVPMMAAIAARAPQIWPQCDDAATAPSDCCGQRRRDSRLLSGGRCIMAVGLGADDKEADAFNVPRTQRAALTDESVAILRKLWAGPHVSHHGTYFHFDDVTITPGR